MTLREKINKIYYDWANDPEFIRKEKYPNDKKPADSLLSAILDAMPKNKSESVTKQAEIALKFRDTYTLQQIRFIVIGWNDYRSEVIKIIGGKK